MCVYQIYIYIYVPHNTYVCVCTSQSSSETHTHAHIYRMVVNINIYISQDKHLYFTGFWRRLFDKKLDIEKEVLGTGQTNLSLLTFISKLKIVHENVIKSLLWNV